MAHEYSKEARASHERKLKAYGEGAKGEPKNFAGFPALNTNKQAGMAPLDKPEELSTETAPRIMRKAGGAVKGAASLKRLDKAKRVGKGLGGARKGPIPTPMEQEEEFDATTYRKPGYMSEVARRQKGGKVENEVEDEDEGHEDEPMDRELVKKMVKKEALTGKSHGGRAHRAEGGSLGDGKKSSMKGRTTIIIAHRLSTIANVDQIVTLRDGKVDEIGPPEVLAHTDGIYAQLLRLQGASLERQRREMKRFDIKLD